MSDYTDVQDDILGTIWSELAGRCSTAVLALFVYDFLLTFGDEVNLFLRPRQLNGPSILFLLNRYLALAVQVYHCSPEPTSYKSIVAWFAASSVIESLQYIPWAAFSALRSYALCPAPYRTAISIAVFALSSVPYVVVNVIIFQSVVAPLISLSPSAQDILTVVARSSLIGAELIVLCITWYRTRETIKMSKRFMAGQDRQTFASTLLRDGTVYFLTLLILNSLNIVFSLFWESSMEGPTTILLLLRLAFSDGISEFGLATQNNVGVTTFGGPLTSIVISRFLINLQKVKRRLHGSSRSMSELAFQSHASRDMDGFIGSLGAQLPFLDEHLGEGEDWP
ncbi:hypothetical protein BD310DRAFT_929357 [Dichomitus squalens]|uniref:DUF6533 domain-containing protein n=1 Tax=Dichomitus squalens TaxID=114155 RepID=A0A4Q9PSV2_9APHY|nr:hypothetical protein BD310DRAFT_929357 [Dichomitus squalens]